MNKAYLCLAAALLAAACAKAPDTEEPARLVLTQRVMPGGVANRDIYSGEVRARYETDVGFRIAGKIVSRRCSTFPSLISSYRSAAATACRRWACATWAT